jgi:hypothetical protein
LSSNGSRNSEISLPVVCCNAKALECEFHLNVKYTQFLNNNNNIKKNKKKWLLIKFKIYIFFYLHYQYYFSVYMYDMYIIFILQKRHVYIIEEGFIF